MNKDRSPAFQFYAKDWRDVKVRRMSLAAQGAYMSILSDMWVDSKDQCSVLDCNSFIAKALGVPVEAWLTLRGEIQHEHEPLLVEENGRLYSERLKEEACKQRKFRKLQSEKGIKSAKARFNRGSTAVQPYTQPNVNSSSSSSSYTDLQPASQAEAPSSLNTLQSLILKDNPDLKSKKRVVETGEAVTIHQVVQLWNDTGLRPCGSVTGPIQDRIKIRIREHGDVTWWVALFNRVKTSDFLTGKVRDWSATLDWVLGPKNLAKIDAGNYDNHKTTSGYTAMMEAFVKS